MVIGNISEERLSSPLSDLEAHGLSLRTLNLLEERGYFKIGDLADVKPKELIDGGSGFGPASLRELRTALASFRREEEEAPGADPEVMEHFRREVGSQMKYLELVGRLRQASEGNRPPTVEVFWARSRGLHRESAIGLHHLMAENERLWAELREYRERLRMNGD